MVRYLKQRVDDVRSKKDKKELEAARLKRHIAMTEHEMAKKTMDPVQRSKMTIEVRLFAACLLLARLLDMLVAAQPKIVLLGSAQRGRGRHLGAEKQSADG